MEVAYTFPELEPYWPHERDLPRIGRGWLFNMVNTVVGARFTEIITRLVKERNAKMAKERDSNLQLDP